MTGTARQARVTKAAEHHVYFAVFGFGTEPQVVTRIMGVEPTKAWAKGDALSRSRSGRHTHSRWVLQSALPLSVPIDAHLENLLPQLECRQPAVAEILRRFEVRLAVAAYWREVNPGFRLSADGIRRIAALGLEMDFDLYCLNAPDEAE